MLNDICRSLNNFWKIIFERLNFLQGESTKKSNNTGKNFKRNLKVSKEEGEGEEKEQQYCCFIKTENNYF